MSTLLTTIIWIIYRYSWYSSWWSMIWSFMQCVMIHLSGSKVKVILKNCLRPKVCSALTTEAWSWYQIAWIHLLSLYDLQKKVFITSLTDISCLFFSFFFCPQDLRVEYLINEWSNELEIWNDERTWYSAVQKEEWEWYL